MELTEEDKPDVFWEILKILGALAFLGIIILAT